MLLMLGWFLTLIWLVRLDCVDLLCRSSSYWYYGILRFLTIFEKKTLKVFATSFSLDSIFPLLTKVIVSLDLTLSERKGSTVCQNFLLLVMSFNFAKYYFFSFLRRETQKFPCLLYINLFWSLGFFKNLFLKRVFAW